ncbi:hypothetical protein [Methanospirillum sp.]|uniref:hypothetical protein n=1 Tax=Methanospirillum sp. TaxID=45200 RepID=UPI0035A02F85
MEEPELTENDDIFSILAYDLTSKGYVQNGRDVSHSNRRYWWKCGHKGRQGLAPSQKELVSPGIVEIQNGTVKIARSLEHADLLKKEMQNFKLKINISTGNELFETCRENNSHGDLIFILLGHVCLPERCRIWSICPNTYSW